MGWCYSCVYYDMKGDFEEELRCYESRILGKISRYLRDFEITN